MRRTFIAIAFILFAGISWLSWENVPGEDLASGYIACHLIANQQYSAVYSHHPEKFHKVTDPAWQAMAKQTGYQGQTYPYVQIPLWAASLQPLCTTLSFDIFRHLFIWAAIASVLGITYLSTRWLAPNSFTPIMVLCLTTAILLSFPYRYSMFLVQTHPIILFTTLSALICAERSRQRTAGILLAFAAAVKITPALLVLYWIMTRNWRAAKWFGVSALCFCALSVSMTSMELNGDFLLSLKRISNVLLIAWNNESLAATVMRPFFGEDDAIHPVIMHLPLWLKLFQTAAAAGLVVIAATLKRKGSEDGAIVSILLLSMTLFAPIAWAHYYVVLIVPIAWLIHVASQSKRVWIVIGILGVLTIDFPHRTIYNYGELFAAGMLALATCIWLSWQRIKQSPAHQAAPAHFVPPQS